MSDGYKPSGALFQNDRKQKNTHPDYNGSLELGHDVIQDLMDQMNSGIEKPKFDLAGWRKVSKNGKNFLSLVGDMNWKRKKELRERGGYRNNSQPTYNKKEEVPF